jgi:hypothetical protein
MILSTVIKFLHASGRCDFNTSSIEMGRLKTRKAHRLNTTSFLTKPHSHLLVKFSKHWRASNLDIPRTYVKISNSQRHNATPWISPPITEGNGAIPSWAPTTPPRYLHLLRLLKKESSSICLETDKYLAEQEWTIPSVLNAPKMCRTQQHVWNYKSFNIPYDYKEIKPPYYFVNTRSYTIEYSCINDGTVCQKNNKNDNIWKLAIFILMFIYPGRFAESCHTPTSGKVTSTF